MMEIVPSLLKFLFLALISVFFFYVLLLLNRSVELDSSRPGEAFLQLVGGGEFVGAEKGHCFPVTSDLTIGRDKRNRIVSTDPFTSNFHAEIIKKNENFYLRDLGSKNGTFLNDRIVDKDSPLRNNDRITIGDLSFKFIMR